MTSFNISYKEIILLLLSAIITLSVALAIIWQFAPTLLGLPADLVLVQSSEKVPPFYENAISKTDLQSKDYLLKDPITKVRAKPFFPNLWDIGPNDILGFRNRSVPNKVDVLFIGDSQLYGNNAAIWQNIPHQVEQILPRGSLVYSMATGGWAAPQYFYAFAKSLVFEPRVVVIAFYTGNDPLESFSLTQSDDQWQEFLNGMDISGYAAPETQFPVPENQQWPVTFVDGTETVFTPALRHASNMEHPAVDAGYRIMSGAAQTIADMAQQEGIVIAFTIIPTKEYVYSDKLMKDDIEMDGAYKALIRDEERRIDEFSSRLKSIEHAMYIDLIDTLKETALDSRMLYPADSNGHPVEFGYRAMARRIAADIKPYVTVPENGVAEMTTINGIKRPVYIRDGRFFIINGNIREISARLDSKPHTVSIKALTGFDFGGYVDPAMIKAYPE